MSEGKGWKAMTEELTTSEKISKWLWRFWMAFCIGIIVYVVFKEFIL